MNKWGYVGHPSRTSEVMGIHKWGYVGHPSWTSEVMLGILHEQVRLCWASIKFILGIHHKQVLCWASIKNKWGYIGHPSWTSGLYWASIMNKWGYVGHPSWTSEVMLGIHHEQVRFCRAWLNEWISLFCNLKIHDRSYRDVGHDKLAYSGRRQWPWFVTVVRDRGPWPWP